MHIISMSIENHPGIGSLTIDFAASDGSPYPVIVLAGENGTGKSSILGAIYAAFVGAHDRFLGISTIEILLTPEEQGLLAEHHHGIQVPARVKLRHDTETGEPDKMFQLIWTDAGGISVVSQYRMHADEVRDILRCYYNEAGMDYNGDPPDSITSLNLDTHKGSSRSAATSNRLAQLLVDIRAADSEDIAQWIEEHPGQILPDEIKDKRIGRFRAAFSTMFPTKKFRGVSRSEGGGIHAEFEERGKISTLYQLSTGEKQIVFRGGYLLRDRQRLRGGIILIDEPELSLHPAWQDRIIPFYRDIVKQDDGSHPQIIVATHSPFIVHGSPGAKIVVLERNATDGSISQAMTPRYPASAGELAVKVFSLEKFLSATAKPAALLTEGKTDAELIRLAWDKLRPSQPMPFDIRHAFGAKNLNVTLHDSELSSKIGDTKLMAIYDFDGEGFNGWNGTWKKNGVINSGSPSEGLVRKHPEMAAWAILLPVPDYREQIASLELGPKSMMAIEMLFRDSDIPANMIEYTGVAGGGKIPGIKNSSKTAFPRHAETLPRESFIAFDALFTTIEGLIST